MKNSLFVALFISFFFIQGNTQEETNIVVSFRPSISATAVKTENIEPFQPFDDKRVNKRKTTAFEFHLNVEMFTKKNFYHYPVLAWSYLKTNNGYKYYFEDKITTDNTNGFFRSDVVVGYGIGKYVYIHKKQVFLNFRNSLAFRYIYGKSEEKTLIYNNLGVARSENIRTTTPANIYGVNYELSPSLGYRVNWFSISLGLPLNFGLNMVNGLSKNITINKDFGTTTEYKLEKNEKQSSTSFAFNYDLELSLRFHIPHKKKDK
ncbi:MAG: hypothetical protein ACPGR5_00995 [Chitinophagales bacterium]